MGDRALCRNEDNLASREDLKSVRTNHDDDNARSTTYSFFRAALIGSFISVFISSSLIVMAVIAGVDLVFMAVIAVLVGIASGTIISGVILPRKHRDERCRLEKYCDHLQSFQLNKRHHALDSLYIDSNCLTGRLSAEVHRIITEAYSGYYEGKQLRRTLVTTIERETRKVKSRLDHVAYLDALTGLCNRRSFDETAAEVITDLRMLSKDVICLTVDIDYFKEVNDLAGHDRGDAVLRFLADSIRSVIRDTDRAYRLGGDEFVILLSDITLKHAAEVARRLQVQFSQMPWNYENAKKPSLSIGGASMEKSSIDSLDELLKQSDQAMYGAKRAGKAREHILGLETNLAA